MKGERGGILFRFISLIFMVVACFALYLVRHPLLRAFAHAWLTSDPIERSDAILVLSDDNFDGDRATQAAKLYRQGMAPVVVASGRRLRPYAGIAELIQHDLEQHGVPKKAILACPHETDDTKDESAALLGFVQQHNWRRVIVVTSDFHARRTRYIFRRIFPAQIEVRVSGAPDEDFDAEHWWEKRRSVKIMFHEIVGMAVAMWELRHKDDEHVQAQRLVGIVRPHPLGMV